MLVQHSGRAGRQFRHIHKKLHTGGGNHGEGIIDREEVDISATQVKEPSDIVQRGDDIMGGSGSGHLKPQGSHLLRDGAPGKLQRQLPGRAVGQGRDAGANLVDQVNVADERQSVQRQAAA